MSSAQLSLQDWSNFYVIAGSSAAGLTGLTFVVIALAADAHLVRLSGLRVFITPTMVHFGSVLWIACLMSIPGQSDVTLAACMGVSGAAGTTFSAKTSYRMYRLHRDSKDYVPVFEDWLWNAALPLASYLALLGCAVWTAHGARAALYGIGAVTLLLLFIGIHNAWDIAVWITAERPGVQPPSRPPEQED